MKRKKMNPSEPYINYLKEDYKLKEGIATNLLALLKGVPKYNKKLNEPS